jgi:hypothetical protein
MKRTGYSAHKPPAFVPYCPGVVQKSHPAFLLTADSGKKLLSNDGVTYYLTHYITCETNETYLPF